MSSRKKDKTPDFESALAQLEALVERMERGDLGLEESLRDFERGMALLRRCRAALQEAEQRVEALLDEDEAAEPVPFTPPDTEAP